MVTSCLLDFFLSITNGIFNYRNCWLISHRQVGVQHYIFQCPLTLCGHVPIVTSVFISLTNGTILVPIYVCKYLTTGVRYNCRLSSQEQFYLRALVFERIAIAAGLLFVKCWPKLIGSVCAILPIYSTNRYRRRLVRLTRVAYPCTPHRGEGTRDPGSKDFANGPIGVCVCVFVSSLSLSSPKSICK